MLSRLLNKALVKLEVKDTAHQVTAKAEEARYPTLSFPPPPRGTRALCPRCLTLLLHFSMHFGDGNDYQPLTITHSAVMRNLSHAVQMNSAIARNNTSECVICIKAYILFKAMQAHVSFEDSWRSSPSTDWILSWEVKLWDYEPNNDRLNVKLWVKHKGGYAWGTGGFTLCPDWRGQRENLDDIPLIGSLDGKEDRIVGQQPPLDFSSTLSPGTLSLATSWAKECSASHSKCNRVFGDDVLTHPSPWFPDRLIQVRRKESGDLTARLILKSNTTNFPTPDTQQLNYLSFSHCWGPPPNPAAHLGGRAGSVLTADTLPKWINFLPVNELPLAFRHAITVCALLGFEYIWIDSLCILQDSKEDWQTQSAVMGDVYKFAFLNIAALSSTSDYDGFIFTRDNRVVFGFRTSFADILGRYVNEVNQQGKQCVLLNGRARLLWHFSKDIQGSTADNTPLFTRGWVHQERCLARRTLAFANSTVYWACDEKNNCERPGWGGLHSQGLRTTLHTVTETITSVTFAALSRMTEQQSQQMAMELIRAVDYHWHGTVTSYTACKLTKHSDKLIAVSSIARELANTKILQNHRYLAGFWNLNLLAQLGWITVVGKTTPPRKRVGEEGYAAPSWSWASIEAPTQPRNLFPVERSDTISLADVLAADVELSTNFVYGSVKAGWIRLRGVLNRVRSGGMFDMSNALTDELTGEKLWFCSDTREGLEIFSRDRASSLVWMPLTVRFDNSISCTCLVLMEEEGSQYGGPKGFIRSGEKVYRRIGTGNFGKLISMLTPSDLVLSLGTYPPIQEGGDQGLALCRGFKRKEVGIQEFVLI